MVAINHISCFFIISVTIISGNGMKYVGDCESLLQSFATSAADFMLCSISNARPIRMCSSCVGSYNNVNEDHTKILEISESDNITCKNRLINLDRLEVIEAGYTYVVRLWKEGQCPNCFEIGEPLPINLSNATLTFFDYYTAMDTCMNKFFDPDAQTYSSGVCTNCSEQYYKMNVFYAQLKQHYGDGLVCMDIVDAMNITQNLWSGVLHCGEDIRTLEVPLVAISVSFLALPILFYLAAWKWSSTTPAPVSLQKRLRTSFAQASESQQKRLGTRIAEVLRSRAGSMISTFRH